MRDGYLLGWAVDPLCPGEPVQVDVRFDGLLLGRFVADRERTDLRRKGIGDGRHGFRVALGGTLAPGSTHRIAVRVPEDGTLLPLADGYLGDGGAGSEPVVLTVDRGARRVSEWLFPEDGAGALARSLGTAPADPAVVWERVRRLANRHELCASLGIHYLAVAMPPKAAVYADHLPGAPTLAVDGRPAARLGAALRDEPRAELLDLYPVLREARRHGRLFTRSGSGLTWKGAFHAYRAVAKELGKRLSAVVPLPVDALELGDLVPIEGALSDEDPPELEPALARSTLRTASAAPLTALILMEAPVGRLAVFLAEHFERTTVEVRSGPPDELVERASPDVVVQFLADGGELLG